MDALGVAELMLLHARNIFALLLGLAQNLKLLAAFNERLYLRTNGSRYYGLGSVTPWPLCVLGLVFGCTEVEDPSQSEILFVASPSFFPARAILGDIIWVVTSISF